RARAGSRRRHRRARAPARRTGRERGHAHRPAAGAVAARHRRRHRRRGRDRDKGARGGGRGVKRRFLEVDDLTSGEFRHVLDTATSWKRDPARVPRLLDGRGVAMYFEKPSARTRVSTEIAVSSLGGHAVYLRPEEVGMGVREAVPDVARMLAALCSVIAARVHAPATLETLGKWADVPVVNLLSDRAHPCQAVGDLLTLEELLGSLEGRRLAFVGDGNNVAASLAFACALS